MLTALAIYLLVGVVLTMISIEVTRQVPKPQLSVILLLVGAVTAVPITGYYLCVKIFGGGK